MPGQVPIIVEAKPVPQGMWYLLRPLQLCSSRHCRQHWGLPLLRQYDHPPRQTQVPLKYFEVETTSSTFLINFFGAYILSFSLYMYKYVCVCVRVLPVARKTELIHIPMNK